MPDIKVTLTVIEGPEKGKTFAFTEPENFLLGRDAQDCCAHLRLSPDDTYVSRNHFLLEINPPDCFIRDAGSLNGTFVISYGRNTIFCLRGREEEKGRYSREAESIRKKLGYATYREIDERLPLQENDLIKVGRTMISVSVTKRERGEKGYQISLDASGEVVHCIECNKRIDRRFNHNDARRLSSDDYVCDDCLKKRAEIQKPKASYHCSQCGKDVTAIADKDKNAVEFRDVALYLCEDCLKSYVEGKQPAYIGGYSILSN